LDRTMIQKGRDIVTFIYRQHYFLALYREFAKKELLKYVETRFAYNFLILHRLFNMRHELRQLVVSSQWVGWENSRSHLGIEVTSCVLSSDFWEEVELLISIVGPINRMMRLVDGDTPCMGKVYEGMDRVIEHIQGLDLDESKITSLKEMCIKRWDQFHVPLYAAAYILDPEFQGKGQERDREVVRGWEKVLDRLIPMENHCKVIFLFNMYL